MLNKFPLWKNIMVFLVIAIGFFYALPNLYGEDPALQISGTHGTELDQKTVDSIKNTLDAKNISGNYEFENSQLLIRFKNTDEQLAAREIVSKSLSDNYIVALNLAPATPEWMRNLGMHPLKLGLDLRGGVHFLMEVDMDEAMKKIRTQIVNDFRTELRNNNLRLSAIKAENDYVLVEFRDENTRDEAVTLLSKKQQDFAVVAQDIGDKYCLRATMTPAKLSAVRTNAVDQNINIIRNRVNELGVAEPLVQRQGADRLVVELPGVQDTARAKEILGATATLEFRLVDSTADIQAAAAGHVPAGCEVINDAKGYPVVVQKQVILTGDHIVDASSSADENGRPQVNISLDSRGGSIMSEFTKDNIGKPMGTNFIEFVVLPTEDPNAPQPGQPGYKPKFKKVERMINVATIQARLGTNFRITGLDSPKEAHNLALLLRAGALIAPIQIVEERTIGPSLGQQNISNGLRAMLYGVGFLCVFMVIYYKAFGLIANLALLFNLVLLVGVMSLIPGATMTLPGIAGIVLTLGMAIDANVLIYERIREEIRQGRPIQQAINEGYARAFVTIADSNITSFITALILFMVGTGAVKGFALVLMIGLASSMFTAVTACRAVVNIIFGGRNLKKLSI
ncbi:MAG: protein translocase subunit SecD [Succinivibrio sp.]|nr:protein translocase subunit SecD [Succinivibrio sp.]MCI5576322.1 protein translocase subunit SecD [Succinivibrio sp.]MCI6449528.1 protein translocase subunit SecD [Succinivibrio sp.]MDD7287087.1 protein translocase subunit SecD [Succinivibrio sp.]MDY3107320.1 protein translocase subunit SecD [Succinivibrio sp.]